VHLTECWRHNIIYGYAFFTICCKQTTMET
jgi:hypothetical protein